VPATTPTAWRVRFHQISVMKIHIINNFVVAKGSAFDSMVREGAGDHHIMVQRLDLMALLLEFLSTSS